MSNFTQSDAKVRIYLDMATFYLNNLQFFDKSQGKNLSKLQNQHRLWLIDDVW